MVDIKKDTLAPAVNCLDQLCRLALIQEERLEVLLAKERQLDRPLRAVNTAIRDYGKLLFRIQEIRFDLGLDEYRRGMPIQEKARAGSTSDETMMEKSF